MDADTRGDPRILLQPALRQEVSDGWGQEVMGGARNGWGGRGMEEFLVMGESQEAEQGSKGWF